MSFPNALRIQIRSLGAAFSREVEQEAGDGGIEFLASIAEPILHIAILCFWHYIVAMRPIYGPSTMLFISTGMFPMFVFIHVSMMFRLSMMYSAPGRSYPIEMPLDLMLAQAALRLFIYTIVGVVLFVGLFYIAAREAYPYRWSAVLLSFAGMAGLGIGVGMVNAVIGRIYPMWLDIWGALSRSLIIFSGILYVPDFQPTFLRDWLVWLPTLHGIALFREGFYPSYPNFCTDQTFFFASVLVSLVFGLGLERLFRNLKPA